MLTGSHSFDPAVTVRQLLLSVAVTRVRESVDGRAMPSGSLVPMT